MAKEKSQCATLKHSAPPSPPAEEATAGRENQAGKLVYEHLISTFDWYEFANFARVLQKAGRGKYEPAAC